MKNKDIHKTFDNAEIRDFLSNALMQKHPRSFTSFDIPFDKKDPWTWHISEAEHNIEYNKKCVEHYKTIKAAMILMTNMGWKEFDVSDETDGDGDNDWMSFLGTEEEYKDLMGIINADIKNA